MATGRMTLLEMVQSILESMDSDDVNAHDETEESLQVTGMLRDTYFALMSDKDWPHLQKSKQLESVSDSSRPTELKIPDVVARVDNIRYNTTETGDTNTTFTKLDYLSPEDFLDKVLQRSTSDTNVDTITLGTGTIIFVQKNKMPQWWTSFDDEHIVLDSYDVTEESTVQGNKTMAQCTEIPTWTDSDTFIPDIPINMFPLLLAEAKRASHIYLKQQDSPVDAKRALQGKSRQRQVDRRANVSPKHPRFGRR